MPSVASPVSPNSKHSQPSLAALAAKRLLRVKEAAEYLSLSAWKVRQLVQDGLLPVVRSCDGGAWRIDVLDLNAFIERNKTTDPWFPSTVPRDDFYPGRRGEMRHVHKRPGRRF